MTQHLATEEITSTDAEHALDLVRKICTEVGPGLPGSPQELERAATIKKELELALGAENVVMEEFTVAQNAFVGSFYIIGVLTIAAVILNVSTGNLAGVFPLLSAVSAVGLSVIPLLLFVVGFLLGFDIIDSFFGKRESVNVVGSLRRPETKVVKHLLILSGHHDSAWENNWLRLPGYGFYVAEATWFAGLIAMPVMAIIQLVGVVTGELSIVHIGTLGWVLLVYPIAPFIGLALFYNTKRTKGGTVPGAADNLSACGVVAATCRFLVRNPERIPPDTEVRFITFGSEEAGLRGSRHYVERHSDELHRLDARLLNLEIVAHREISILTSEINGTVRNSPEMVRSVVAAAERSGVPFKVKAASLGVASDAGPFSRSGIKATTLVAFEVPKQMFAFYHQKWDRPEVLGIVPLLNAIKTSVEWIGSGGNLLE